MLYFRHVRCFLSRRGVLEPQIFDYLDLDLDQRENLIFEKEPLERLAADGQLVAYKHDGFWRCMDTMRDKETLETLWNQGKAHGQSGGIEFEGNG